MRATNAKRRLRIKSTPRPATPIIDERNHNITRAKRTPSGRSRSTATPTVEVRSITRWGKTRTNRAGRYQRHRPVPDTDIEETLSVLSDLMRAGKVRAIGTCTLPAADLV